MATETLKHISFPDIDGLTFAYDPEKNGPKANYVQHARAHADDFKKQMSSRLASAVGSENSIFVEYMGYPEEPYFVGIPGDAPISLTRDQVVSLRDGLSRILDTEERDGHEGTPDREGLPSYWAMAAGFLVTEVDLGVPCPPSE